LEDVVIIYPATSHASFFIPYTSLNFSDEATSDQSVRSSADISDTFTFNPHRVSLLSMRFTVGTILTVLVAAATAAPSPIVACDAATELDPRYLIITDVDYNKAHRQDSSSRVIDSRAPHGGENSKSPPAGLFQPSRIHKRQPNSERGLRDKLEPGKVGILGLDPLNAFTGHTTINAGTLQLGEANELPGGDRLLQIKGIN
jgi:hypothetical protein